MFVRILSLLVSMWDQNCPKSQSYQKYLLSVAVFTSLHEYCSNQTGNHYTNISIYLKVRLVPCSSFQNEAIWKLPGNSFAKTHWTQRCQRLSITSLVLTFYGNSSVHSNRKLYRLVNFFSQYPTQDVDLADWAKY